MSETSHAYPGLEPVLTTSELAAHLGVPVQTIHDLRHARGFKACLAPDSYVASQALADSLLSAGSLGVVYPSVRHAGGTCVACFRPALVSNVRRAYTYRFTWTGGEGPRIDRVRR